MKKIAFLLLLLAATYGLKAQQLLKVNPAESLSHLLMDSYFKQQPNKGFNFLQPSFKLNEALAINKTKPLNSNNQDHMPVAALDGNSKMPVIKIGGYYTMPVKQIGTEDPTVGDFSTMPRLPMFMGPGK